MTGRRILANYRLVSPTELTEWLFENGYKHAFVPYDTDPDRIGTMLYYIEVYCEEAETAVRLKWDVE